MNSKALSFVKNFSYAATSNLVTLIAAFIAVLLVPKLIGVEEYGFWQLYIFYSSYVGLLHFGWNDGIYLRYGGQKYEELNKKVFFSQFYMLLTTQLVIFSLISIVTIIFLLDDNRIFIIQMVAVCLLVINVRNMLLFILQATNRIKEYAQITMLEKLPALLFMVSLLYMGAREFKLLIVADLVSKAISLGCALYFCKDLIFGNKLKFRIGFQEMFLNIRVGIQLMFANVASLLIIGTVRFGIERSWEVATFGKVSLALSLSNLLMVFINAVGIIMFPVLRRSNPEKLPTIYLTIRDILMVLLLGMLIVYYPLKISLATWLPEFSDALIYLALLFPICIYEGKIALLINTYLKSLRKEKLMLRINLTALVLAVSVTFLSTVILKSLDLAVFSIILLLAFRCIFAEIYLSKHLRISVVKDILLELSITLVLMISAWFIDSWITLVVYIIAYSIYLIIKKENIKSALTNVKQMFVV
ncbi:MATE family efflux transporter [Paenibacillus senegalensis]|uniref:hypothetical protein n=1 Tax=Paenibacillus senegalensis TaxID=1465766 RepID=UPI000288FBDD|nr:hypothetical protein [Paenibacillus senegalensis]